MKNYFFCIILFVTLGLPGRSQEVIISAPLDAGRNRIEQMIEKYSLYDSLSECPYLGFFSGRVWIIVCDKESFFQTYYGHFDANDLFSKQIPSDNESLRDLFSQAQSDFINPVIDDTYYPFYSYFVLYDSSHECCIECNSYMRKTTSDAINSHHDFISY